MVYCDEPDMDSVKNDCELQEYIRAECKDGEELQEYIQDDCIQLMIEKRQLWPCQEFVVNSSGGILAGGGNLHVVEPSKYLWSADVYRSRNCWQAMFCISWSSLNMKQQPSKPIRINLRRIIPNRNGKGFAALSWGGCNPIVFRNLLPNDNPADFGWLFLDNNSI